MDKCWAGCGSEGAHPEWGNRFWPCGTMKSGSIRGEVCYETELAALKELLRKGVGIIRQGVNNTAWPGVELMKLKEIAFAFVNDPEVVKAIDI